MSHTTNNLETIENRCPCEPQVSIQFLDTSCSVEEGKIRIDLFKKKTDRNQYLLKSSCHPMQTTTNTPYSLAHIIVRTCTHENDKKEKISGIKTISNI